MNKECFVLYPIYIDSTKTIQQGRKYQKSMCIENPNSAEINSALKHLQLEFVGEPEKRHPKDSFKFGRFKINKMYGKNFVIEGIINTIKNDRISRVEEAAKGEVESAKANKGFVKNRLNLVPKKKKKGKK